MVEFAISIVLFLLVALGIIEFALLVFDMSRANELTRDLSRLAITADPVCDVFGTRSALGACSGGTLTVVINSTTGNPECQGGPITVSLNQVGSNLTATRMLTRAQQLLGDVQGSQIAVVYSCSNSGNPLRPRPVPLVTVRLQNYTRPFLLPGFLGLDTGFDFPPFEVTRLGEDLYTEV